MSSWVNLTETTRSLQLLGSIVEGSRQMVMISRPSVPSFHTVFTQALPFLGSDVVKWKSNSLPLVHETASVPNPGPANFGLPFWLTRTTTTSTASLNTVGALHMRAASHLLAGSAGVSPANEPQASKMMAEDVA